MMEKMENLDNSVVEETQTETNNQPTQPVDNQSVKTAEFNIPETYKDKSWAKNIKSQEDLFKSYDNAQSLIGKKTIGMPDFEKATDEELKEYYSKTAPADIKDYEFGEIADSDKEFFGSLFKENGLNKRQAKDIYNKYMEYSNQYRSDDDFQSELKNRFGENSIKTLDETKSFLNKYLGNEDKNILDKMPNKVVGMMLEFANNVKKDYGIDIKSSIDKGTSIQAITSAQYQSKAMEFMMKVKEGKLTPQQHQEEVIKLQELAKLVK